MQQFSTRAYIILPNGTEYTLEYRLECEEAPNESTHCITVELIEHEQIVDSADILFCETERAALNYLDLFARNTLFPSSLCDVAHDLELQLCAKEDRVSVSC